MMLDPRVDITHQIKAGQFYVDDRTGDELHLVYIDNNHVLLKDGEYARLLTVRDFETDVGAGRYKINGTAEVIADVAYTSIDFKKIDGVGDKTARALQRAGYTTAEDVERAEKEDLLAISGVGEGNLNNIELYIKHMAGQVTF